MKKHIEKEPIKEDLIKMNFRLSKTNVEIEKKFNQN